MKNKSLKAENSFIEGLPVFEFLKRSASSPFREQKNVIDFKKNRLFVWNSDEKCLSSIIINQRMDLPSTVPSVQKYRPLNAVSFDVKKIRLNDSGTICCLVSTNDAFLLYLNQVQLLSEFSGECTEFSCQLHKIGIEVSCTTAWDTANIRQIRWYPSRMVKDDLLCILSDDNTFRVYSSLDRALMYSCDLVNPSDDRPLSRKATHLRTLENQAIDFDFVSVVKLFAEEEDLPTYGEYAVVILRQSGDVCILQNIIGSKKGTVPVLSPSLIVNPREYGEMCALDEPCSILAFDAPIPIIAIVDSAGNVHHCFLTYETERTSRASNSNLFPPDSELFIFERLELNWKFQDVQKSSSEIDADETLIAGNCNFLLHKDPFVPYRYYCSHNYGLHSITVPMYEDLKNYVDSDNSEDVPDSPSIVEYKICSCIEDPPQVSLIGLTFIESLSKLVALYENGQLFAIPVSFSSTIPYLTNTQYQQKEGKEQQNPLTFFLRDCAPKEGSRSAHSILQRHAEALSEDAIAKFMDRSTDIKKRTEDLQLSRENQKRNLENLETQKKNLRKKAEHLANIYEDLTEKQETLRDRFNRCISVISHSFPEKQRVAFSKQLASIVSKVEKLEERTNYIVTEQIEQDSVLESDQPVPMDKAEKNLLLRSLINMAKEINHMQVNLRSFIKS